MSDEEWEVEKILDHKYVSQKLKYLVKWVGFDNPSDNTWEPYQNLENCNLIKNEYLKLKGLKELPNIIEKEKEKINKISIENPKKPFFKPNFNFDYQDEFLKSTKLVKKSDIKLNDYDLTNILGFDNIYNLPEIKNFEIIKEDNNLNVYLEINNEKIKLNFDIASLLFQEQIFNWYEKKYL